MKVVAGLGNPGAKYSGTRHNVGFEVLAVLAERFQAPKWRSKFDAQTTEISVGGERVLLVAPQTYMNLSGRSIRMVIDFFKVPQSELLVVCDDINLENGRLRLRGSGSAGGQKGLQNTIDQLGSPEFARLRFGVGRPPGHITAANYVLQQFPKAEHPLVRSAIDRAASAVETWAREGIVAAMNRFNAAEDG